MNRDGTLRRKVLIVTMTMQPPGGGQGVGAWMLQALQDVCEVTLLAWHPLDTEAMNRYYGTTVDAGKIRLVLVPSVVRRVVALSPVQPLVSLQLAILSFMCRQRQHRYDVCVSANNELDMGRPGLQYVHHPFVADDRYRTSCRTFLGSQFLSAYRFLCRFLSGTRPERALRNLSLANSSYTAEATRRLFGDSSIRIVYPPVVGIPPLLSWAERDNGFVLLGRIATSKRADRVLRILEAVRARGHDVQLHIVGNWEDLAVKRLVEQSSHPWLHVHENLSRTELHTLLGRQRYGIHGMIDEHFGMAVAEMVRAGCIVFVPDSGGPPEIVGRHPDLLYSGEADAVEKIDRTLRDAARQQGLLEHLEAARRTFSSERFVAEIQEIVCHFQGGAALAP